MMADDAPTPGSPSPVHKLRDAPTWALVLAPVVLFALAGSIFLAANPLADAPQGEALPDVTVTNHQLPSDDEIVLSVTNNGPEPVTIQHVLVDEAYWNHTVLQDGVEDRTLGAQESSKVVIPYHWEPGWDYEIALLLDDGATFHHTIEAAQPTPTVTGELVWDLALIGLFVGVIPVGLGMGFFPAIKNADRRWLDATIAFAGGVLLFLALDGGFEVFEIVERVPAYLDGALLVCLAAVSSLLLIQAVSSWLTARGSSASSGLRVGYMIAIGIGLHNLGEGLAIGSSIAQGHLALGSFLILGFMVHNVTEGPAIVAPIAEGKRPAWWHFALIGLIAGVPVIPGGWIGSFAYSPTLGAVALAVGVGAILQVLVELAGWMREESQQVATATNLVAFGVGLAAMYATDLLVVL
jgi:zinc transporter ZupT